MRRWIVVVLCAMPCAAWAQEEDDPAMSRQPAPAPPAPAEELDEPMPAPVPPEEEDPGFAPAAPPPTRPDPSVRRRVSRPPAPRGIKLRIGYRTWQLGEASIDSTKTDRFHAISLDAYPISSEVRFGLVSQAALEGDGDWFGTVGMALGIQRPGRPWTPFGEVMVHTGVGRRSFCGLIHEALGCEDHLTLLWGFGIEAGVDGRLFGSTIGTVAIGVQKNQFFSVEVQGPEGDLVVFDDVTVTLKVGLGY